MVYKNILPGKFISRPNRFIANIEIDEKTEVCHIKNTGRCKELLIPGADVFVQESDNKERKTRRAPKTPSDARRKIQTQTLAAVTFATSSRLVPPSRPNCKGGPKRRAP